ncbi:MAG: alpha/beta fold hydrolase [Coriobacteriia bacterium]|nr:alpha/beta fold hydrolase [Coriobacteriia bacterium]
MIGIAGQLKIVVLVLAGWVMAVWACGAVYIVVTYIEATRHIPHRSALDTARSVLRECWCVAWSQPLLPLFQIAGERLSGSGRSGTPIVLVHGYCQNRVDFLYLAHRLRNAGCGPIHACNFFWPQPLEASAETVVRFVERIREVTGAEQVDLLTHSSGGLLALDVLEKHPHWVRRTCVIAIPWRGVTWTGPVIGRAGSQLRADSLYTRSRPHQIMGGPVLSIYSAHDNLVHPPETSRVAGPFVSAREVENLGHLAILFDRTVGDAVCEFLLAPDEVTGAAEAASPAE